MTGHAGDLLSALLDGQLTAAEATSVREHVAGCGECAGELDAVRDARRMLRTLAAVEPPDAFIAELLVGGDVVPLARRRSRRLPVVAAAAGVLVIAGLATVVLSSSDDTVDPEVASAVEKHSATVEALEAEGEIDRSAEHFPTSTSVPPTTARPLSTDDLDSSYEVRDDIGDYRFVEAYEAPDGVHLLYRSGEYALSIFETRGEADFDALPGEGTRLRIAGHEAWRSDEVTADGRLYVVDLDGLVLVVVGDEPGNAVLAIITELLRSAP